MRQIRDALVLVLEDASDTLVALMRNEIERTTHGDAPGKPEWRESLGADLREVYRIVAEEAIEFGIGLPYMGYADVGYKFARAMLVAYGSGSEAGGEAIHSRPGELVWDDDLHDFQPSTALSEYNLPDAFNQVGNDFIANAMKLMQAHFRQTLAHAGARLPAGLFTKQTYPERR